MDSLLLDKEQCAIDEVSKFNVQELTQKELGNINGGAAISGAAAVAVAVGGGLAVIAAGVLVGVGIYYGVKWLTN